jgi:hypothetical protein
MRSAGAADPTSRCGARRVDGGGTPSETSVRAKRAHKILRFVDGFTLRTQNARSPGGDSQGARLAEKTSTRFRAPRSLNLSCSLNFRRLARCAFCDARAREPSARYLAAFACAKLLHRSCVPRILRRARLPESGASGSVRQGPANPARPGREQRYRDRLVRRRPPEVPLTASPQFAIAVQYRRRLMKIFCRMLARRAFAPTVLQAPRTPAADSLSRAPQL